MSLNVALQMDHPSEINIDKDSTFILGLEAQKRGYSLSFYHPSSLKLLNGKVFASCASLQFECKKGAHFTLGEFKDIELTSFDIILMRQNFTDALNYEATTHILEHITDQVLIINDPKGVRESPEKILIAHYPDLIPPTLMSRRLEDIQAFQNEYGDLIIKPLNGFGGMDIYHIKSGDVNLKTVHEMMSRLHPEPFIVQQYIPAVREGDKRIILIEGEPVGALLRVPKEGSARANLAAGGTAIKAEITERERDICAQIKPELVRRGLVLVGLDVIGGYVTEINPKSPTGLQEINRFDGICLEALAWDAFEARLNQFNKAT